MQLQMIDSESGSDGGGLATLRIGGVTLRVDGSGNVASRRRANAAAPRRRVGLRPDLPRDPYAATFTTDDEESETISRQQQRKLQKQLRYGVGGGRTGAASASSEGDAPTLESDAALEDYLANVDGSGSSSEEDEEGSSGGSEGGGSGSGIEGEGGRGGGRAAAAAATPSFDVLRRFSSFDMGDEGPIGGRGWDTPGSSSSEEGEDGSDSDEDDSGSELCGSDEVPALELAADLTGGGSGLLTAAELEGLSLAQRYPVLARPAPPPPLPGQPAAGSGKRARAGVRGAKGGKLAPGEKALLRRERIKAKRAARAASRGFDLAWVDHQLQEMVARHTDMLVSARRQGGGGGMCGCECGSGGVGGWWWCVCVCGGGGGGGWVCGWGGVGWGGGGAAVPRGPALRVPSCAPSPAPRPPHLGRRRCRPWASPSSAASRAWPLCTAARQRCRAAQASAALWS